MATYTDAIQKLYVAYFSRPADPAGLAYWEGVVTAAKGDTSAVSAAFAASTEYQTAYAQVNVSGVITQIYENLFGNKTPDAAGLAYWIDAINKKVFTIDQAVTKIAAGAQGSDKVAYDSKVLVATSFTAAVDTDAEKAGYNGKDANKAAKDFLATIKTAADATAAITPAALDAKVAAVVKAGVPFTVAGGLTALAAAIDARDAFLVTADGDNNALSSASESSLDDAVTTQKGLVAAKVVGYNPAPGASAGVNEAVLADQIDANAKKLLADQVAATKAADAVAKVAGLASALAADTAADAAAVVAQKALGDAAAKLTFAEASYAVVNGGAAPVAIGNGTVAGLITLDAATSKILVLAPGITEVTNPGVTAILEASKANQAAIKADAAAKIAAAAAQKTLDHSDFLRDGGPIEAAMQDIADGMKIVKLEAGKYPTGAQIDTEIAGLTAIKVAADAVVTAAGADATGDQKAAALTATNNLDTFKGLVTAFEAKDLVNPLAAEQALADAAVKADGKAITDLSDLVAKLAAAQALVTELKGLNTEIIAAGQNFVDHGFAKPETLSTYNIGTADADIFVAGKVNSTVVGLEHKDMLFIGTDYVLNAGKPAAGNNAVLEIFLAQSGANTVVTMEKAAYGSESGDVITITLVGVNATDVHFTNGIVTV